MTEKIKMKPIMRVFCKRDFDNLKQKYQFTTSDTKSKVEKAKDSDVLVLQTQFRDGFHCVDNAWILNKHTPIQLFMELMFGEIEPEKEEKVMVCAVCGEIDDSYTAYCGRCGRVTHRLMTRKKQKEFKKMLDKFKE